MGKKLDKQTAFNSIFNIHKNRLDNNSCIEIFLVINKTKKIKDAKLPEIIKNDIRTYENS